jgi:hypothetical protein
MQRQSHLSTGVPQGLCATPGRPTFYLQIKLIGSRNIGWLSETGDAIVIGPGGAAGGAGVSVSRWR